jgi:hypothetical protein
VSFTIPEVWYKSILVHEISEKSAWQVTLIMPNLQARLYKMRTRLGQRQVDGAYSLTMRKIAMLEEKTLG